MIKQKCLIKKQTNSPKIPTPLGQFTNEMFDQTLQYLTTRNPDKMASLFNNKTPSPVITGASSAKK